MKIQVNLPSNFYDYWKKGLFIDYILKTKDEDIPCHRIILSKNSKFFFREFCTQKENVNEYMIQFNPGDIFANIINYMYTGTIDLTVDNFAQYAAICQYYEFNNLFNNLDKYFTSLFQKENAYKLIHNFCTLKVQRYHEKIIEFLLQYFQDFDMKKIIMNSDSKLLSGLLKKITKYTIEEKIRILDNFTQIHQDDITDLDKDYLTSIYDFLSDENSYLFLIFYKCDWMTSPIQRKLLMKILTKRREEITNFEEMYSKSFEKSIVLYPNSELYTGKWTTFSSISKIANLRKHNEVDLIEFIQTLDGSIEKINPILLGFITINHSDPISPQFGGSNIFHGYYFASDLKSDVFPFIEFSLNAKNNFSLHSFQLEKVPVNGKNKPERPSIGKVELQLSNDTDKPFIRYIDDPNKPNIFNTETDQLQPASAFKITMISENSSGGWILRFSYPRIRGEFVLDFSPL